MAYRCNSANDHVYRVDGNIKMTRSTPVQFEAKRSGQHQKGFSFEIEHYMIQIITKGNKNAFSRLKIVKFRKH